MAGPGEVARTDRGETRAMLETSITSSVEELRFRLQGGVHEPGDESYEDTCTLFNTMIDRRPLLVAECVAVEDVVAALAFARDRDLPIAVRAGGHSVAGLSLCDDGVVLDVRGMADIEVDANRRILRVGGGAIWVDVDRATQAHGLATTGGRVSTTGVAGRTLRDVMNDAPDELSLACAFITAPEDDDDVPADLRGRPAVAVLGMWAGSVADGERALAPIRALGPDADFFGQTGYADFQCLIDDPPGYRNYWTAENVIDLPDVAIDLLVRRATELPAGPSQLFIVAWGGAVRRFGPEHSPLAGREARFIVHPLLLWEDPADDERCRALGRAFRSDVQRWSIGATYPNFLGDEGSARMSAAFGPSTAGLAAVKAKWDPHGAFRTHQAIRATYKQRATAKEGASDHGNGKPDASFDNGQRPGDLRRAGGPRA